MGSSKKHKEKDRKKHRKRSRSRDREKRRKRRHHHDSDDGISSKRAKELSEIDELAIPRKARETLDFEDLASVKKLKESAEADDYIIAKKQHELHESETRVKEEPLDDLEDDESSLPEGNGELSLGISETNRLRAKLGLKPLEITEEVKIPGLGDDVPSSSEKKEIFVKTENLARKEEAEKLKEKIATQREKRVIQAKLSKVKGLAESDSEEESAAQWVMKSRKIQDEKEMAERRAKLLEEMDKEFGVGALVEEEFNSKNKAEKSAEKKANAVSRTLESAEKEANAVSTTLESAEKEANAVSRTLESAEKEANAVSRTLESAEKKANTVSRTLEVYTSKDLKGLKVGHSQEVFQEGRNIILTLKDKGVLEEEDDILENVNLIDDEKAAKNAENRLKKPDYTAYDEPEYDEFGIVKKKNLLYKYDEEIHGPKKEKFVIGTPSVDRQKELELIRMKLKQQQGVTLEIPHLKIASEYYTEEEMVQFKKPKKKARKGRKRGPLKPEELLPLPGDSPRTDHGSRRNPKAGKRKSSEKPVDEELYIDGNSSEAMDVDVDKEQDDDVIGPEEDLTGIPVDEDKADVELQVALNKARKLKQKEVMVPRSEKVVEAINSASEEGHVAAYLLDRNKAGAIVLNSTAEFCRTLGEIPTYGMSGNRDEEAEELLDFEKELVEERKRLDQEAQNRGAWNEVDIEERPVEIKNRENEPILEEEPDVSVGLAGALILAKKKGYLEQETKKAASAPRPSQLQAQTYTIEEKFYEDDKFGKRDRYTGPIQDFKEKDIYKPDVKLEYIDDSGRILSAKEAFRYLSHKFHGKGPGKNKVDKRMKKLDQDARLKQMSSTDTPLNTLKMLQEKQKELQTPYIVLSGGSKALTHTSLAKPK